MNEGKKFKYYRRGQIIQVKFEPQTGYEIKGIHYAIVITKRDQPYIGTLTVVPLTSKSGNHLTPIGSCISDSVFLELLREKNYYYDLLLKAKIQTERIQKAGSVLEATTQDELNQIERDLKAYLDNIKYFDDLENKYKNIKNLHMQTFIKLQRLINLRLLTL